MMHAQSCCHSVTYKNQLFFDVVVVVHEKNAACSKRSDSGERCGVEKAMKSRGGLGREVRVPSLTSPPPSLLLFRAPFYFAPLPTI